LQLTVLKHDAVHTTRNITWSIQMYQMYSFAALFTFHRFRLASLQAFELIYHRFI